MTALVRWGSSSPPLAVSVLRVRCRWQRIVLVACLLLAILPVNLALTAPAADTALTFSIGPDVTTEDASTVIEGLTMAEAFVTSTLTRVAQPLVVNIRNTDDTTGRGSLAFYGGGYIVVFTRSAGWLQSSPAVRIAVIVHEYIHVWQDAVKMLGASPALPAWMIEGMADYVAYQAVTELGLINPQAVRDYNEWAVEWEPNVLTLEDLEDLADFQQHQGLGYNIGYLALDRLFNAATDGSLLDFATRVRFGQKWRVAFPAAFGVDISEFYQSFADYRSELQAPARVPLPFVPVLPLDAQSDLAIVDSPAQITEGEQFLVIGDTSPAVTCQFQIADSEQNPVLDASTFADATGLVFWLATAPEDLPAGPVDLTANCGGTPVAIELEVTYGH